MVVILSLFTMQTVLDACTHSRPPWYWGRVQNPTFFDAGLSLIPPLWLSHQHNGISNLNSSMYLFYISFVFILLTTNTWGTQSKHSLTQIWLSHPQLYKHLLNKIKENLFLTQVLAFKIILHRNSDWFIHSKNIYMKDLCVSCICAIIIGFTSLSQSCLQIFIKFSKRLQSHLIRFSFGIS